MATIRGRSGTLFHDARIIAFIVLLAAALLAIYVPSPLGPGILGGPSGNLKYGLDLVGGSRLQIELKGVIVKVDAPPGMNESQILSFLHNETGAEVVPVRYNGEIVYEIRKDITKEQMEEILRKINAGIGVDRRGNPLFLKSLTRETVEETRKIIETKLNMLGLKSITTRTVAGNVIMVDLAGVPLSEARRIIGTPGKFEIRIQTSGKGGDIEEGQTLAEIRNITAHVLYGDEITHVNPMPVQSRGAWGASFRLSDEGAKKLQDAAIKYNAVKDPENHELVMLLDDVVIYSAPLSPSAASSLSAQPISEWIAETGGGEEGKKRARDLIIHLRAGVLPVPVEIIASGEVKPYLGEKFKEGSVIALILALAAVGVIITLRYKEWMIALLIFITLLTEVIVLLGFASAIGWQLDLPSIAGIIAVIGTGVDQMVMITDEAMSGGRTASGRVYYRRVSFAYGIIFASATTTIVAMAVLASMALGTLSGFAIVTIVGLLVGIFVTRPAYAKMLEYLL